MSKRGPKKKKRKGEKKKKKKEKKGVVRIKGDGDERTAKESQSAVKARRANEPASIRFS
jgi:hypothetical protein